MDVLRLVEMPDTEIGVVLKGNADQIGDRVLLLLPQIRRVGRALKGGHSNSNTEHKTPQTLHHNHPL